MKTFDDLEFKPHPYAKEVSGFNLFGDRAELLFDNGYGVSVLVETMRDGYEIAVLKGDQLWYSDITNDDVLRNQTQGQITDVMRQVQELV